ncbi:MAG: SurA N-terminal domain-containing protein [Rubrivivax sp.]|nr:SurA N-terminal domain-containing protein [Rubrivivax sp.]
MFDFVRQHSRLMLGLIVLLIIPSFVFFGIDGYSRMSEGGNATVAKVDGKAVTQAEWDMAHRRAVENMRQRMPGADASLFDSPQARQQSLDGLVRERVLLAAANSAHLFPTDERLQRLFVTDPQFAAIRNPDGTVRKELLVAQGMSSEMFAQQLRTDYGMQQVMGGVARSTVAPAAVAAAGLDALLQQREVQVERFDAAVYRAKVAPTDAELEAWHKANASQFRAPEQANIEYVVLDVAGLAKDVAVPEADLQRYYDENASRYTVAEERRARHILIKAEKDAPAADRAKAKARAEELLTQARAKPAEFAALAKANSQDEGSAAQGGDLDFFGRGAMVKPFEDAVYAMKAGEISPVIETDFGYHIIQFTEQRGGQKKALAEVRPEIEAEVRKTLAQRKYAEAAEQFSNMVYEQADTLQPVLDKFKLEKRTASVQRQPAPGAAGPLASAKLLEAVFKEDTLRNKRNTDAVEVGTSQLAAARVLSYQAERTLPLAEVKPLVLSRVAAEQAAALARKDGEQRLAEAKAKPELTLPVSATISRAQLQNLPRPVVEAALKANPDQLPATVGVDLGTEGYAVLRVAKVLPRDPAAAGGEAALRQQFAQALTTAETQAYYESLKKRYKVTVSPPAAAASAP